MLGYNKNTFSLFFIIFFFSVFSISYASDVPFEVLRKETTYYPARSCNPDGDQYPRTVLVAHAPDQVVRFKEKAGLSQTPILESVDSPPEKSYFSHSPNLKCAGMGDIVFWQEGIDYLETQGVRDCIALVAFDLKTRKSFLYHASKMEIRQEGDILSTAYLSKIISYFGNNVPEISLISSCHSQDLIDLKKNLSNLGLKVKNFNVPDILLVENILHKGPDEYYEMVCHDTNVFVDQHTCPPDVLEKIVEGRCLLPDTKIILDVGAGNITIIRE